MVLFAKWMEGGIGVQLDRIRGRELDQLFEAILSLKTVEECYRFFDDLCTVNEVKALAVRFEVARMIREGHTYQKIERETGASTATISRVKRCLEFGSKGIELALDNLERKKDTKT